MKTTPLTAIVIGVVSICATIGSAQQFDSRLLSIGTLYLNPAGDNTRELTLATLSLGRQWTSRVWFGGELLSGAVNVRYDSSATRGCSCSGTSDSSTNDCGESYVLRSIDAFGADFWGRWDFASRGSWRLFTDASAGLIAFANRYPNVDGNFTQMLFQVGLGISVQLQSNISLQGGVRRMVLAGTDDFRGEGMSYWIGIGIRF